MNAIKTALIKSARNLYLEGGPDKVIFSDIEKDLGLDSGTIESTYYKNVQDLVNKVAEQTSLQLIQEFQRGVCDLTIEIENKNPDLKITHTHIANQRVAKVYDISTTSHWDNRVRLDLPGDTYNRYQELMFDLYVPDSAIFSNREEAPIVVFTVQPAFLWDPGDGNLWNWVQAPREVSFKSNEFRQMSLFQNPVGFETSSWKSGQMSAFPCKSKVAVPKTEVLEQSQVVQNFRKTTVYLKLDWVTGSQLDMLKAVILLFKLGNSFKGEAAYLSNIGFTLNC
jgi:hypothetical protein